MTSRAHNYNFAMQKYMLLQEQHEELSSHLEQIRPSQSSTSSNSAGSTPASSPTRSLGSPSTTRPKRHSRSGERRQSKAHARCSGWEDAQRGTDLGTILDEETLYEIYAGEQRLFDVNEGIKRQLTELLNCNTVRTDMSMRMWAQGRLMETEKELRSGRRRRSSPCGE